MVSVYKSQVRIQLLREVIDSDTPPRPSDRLLFDCSRQTVLPSSSWSLIWVKQDAAVTHSLRQRSSPENFEFGFLHFKFQSHLKVTSYVSLCLSMWSCKYFYLFLMGGKVKKEKCNNTKWPISQFGVVLFWRAVLVPIPSKVEALTQNHWFLHWCQKPPRPAFPSVAESSKPARQ